MSAAITSVMVAMLPLLKELWKIPSETVTDSAKALALKAMAVKMIVVGGGAYGLQYLADSEWVRLLAIQTNLPTHTVDTLGWAGGFPLVGAPFEFARILLVNYWFSTAA